MGDRLPGSSPSNPIVYRFYHIYANSDGYYPYAYAHEDYDGPEDARCGTAKTIDDCKHEIDELIDMENEI
jgi:hypothetical protein